MAAGVQIVQASHQTFTEIAMTGLAVQTTNPEIANPVLNKEEDKE